MCYKKPYRIFAYFFGVFGTSVLASAVSAKKTIGDATKELGKAVEPTGIKKTDVFSYAGEVIQGTLLIVGTGFLVLMVYGGFQWLTSQGNEEQIEKARGTIIAAIIGLVIIIGAYAITNAIAGGLI